MDSNSKTESASEKADTDASSTDDQKSEGRDGKSSGTLTGLLDDLLDSVDGKKVRFGDILDAFDNRSYGPLILIPGLVALSPLGAVPGMSVVTGSIILLIAAQMVIAKSHPWIPQCLESFSFSREKLKSSVKKIRPWVGWIEKALHERLTLFAKPPATYLLSVSCILMALLMYPLALVPFGVAAPAAAVTLFGIGLTARDGVVILLGYTAVFIAIGLTVYSLWG